MSQSAEAMPTRVEKRRFGEGGKAYSETLFGDFPRYLNKSDAYHRHPRNAYAVRGNPGGDHKGRPYLRGYQSNVSLFTMLRSLQIGCSDRRVTLRRCGSEL